MKKLIFFPMIAAMVALGACSSDTVSLSVSKKGY